MTSNLKQHRMDQFERYLRQQGLPLTTQRQAVLSAILDRQDHPTADQVYAAVKRILPTISRTTVYRILDTLVEARMVTKVCHPGSAAKFDPKIHQHHHLVCVRCERIIDIEEARLNDLPFPDVSQQGFHISDYHIHFRGVCAECEGEQNEKARTNRSTRRPKAGIKATVVNPRQVKERKQP